MPIAAIDVSDIADFAGGDEFGEAGPYVRIKGIAVKRKLNTEFKI